MGIVSNPKVWVTDDIITAVDLNAFPVALLTEFNGNIDNTNIKTGANIDAAKLLNASILTAKIADLAITNSKLDYTSVQVLRILGTGGANGKRMASGKKSGLVLIAGALNNIVITYSSDARDGNPNFSDANIDVSVVIIGPGGSTNRYYGTVENVTQTSFTVHILSNVASTDTVSISWMAVGYA